MGWEVMMEWAKVGVSACCFRVLVLEEGMDHSSRNSWV
jgi:hypothetical protein